MTPLSATSHLARFKPAGLGRFATRINYSTAAATGRRLPEECWHRAEATTVASCGINKLVVAHSFNRFGSDILQRREACVDTTQHNSFAAVAPVSAAVEQESVDPGAEEEELSKVGSEPNSGSESIDQASVTPMTRKTDDFQKSPEDIIAELDRHIIGQTDAKRRLAVALRDRWRRQQLTDMELQQEITPNNILLIGPSGCGKTELARRLAKFSGAPFVKCVATKFTEVGFVGDDTHSMIADLAEQGYIDEKNQARLQVTPEARQEALNVIVEALKQSQPGIDRTELLENLEAGKYHGVEIELDSELLQPAHDGPNNPVQQLVDTLAGGGPNGAPGFGLGGRRGTGGPAGLGGFPFFQNGPAGGRTAAAVAVPIHSLDNLFGGKKEKTRRIKVQDAVPLVEEHFISSKINEEEVIGAAKHSVEQRGIVFLDEMDKLVDPKDEKEFHGKRRGVQKELLSLMEGTHVNTRIGRISTEHILFIAAGAFTSAKPSDILPELQGRLPIRCELNPLCAAELVRVLKEPRFNLLLQQKALLATENVTLEFTDAAIDEIAKTAHELNTVTANVGARRLKTVLSKVLDSLKFEAHRMAGKTVKIDRDDVNRELESLRAQVDLTRYII